MTAETIEVTTSSATVSDVTLPLVRPLYSGDRLDLQVWTTVTDGYAEDRPLGRLALVVLEGVGQAINVRINESDSGVSVADVDTGVFGYGDSLPEAVRDFHAALQDHLTVLADQRALSADLRRQQEILRSYFATP